MSNDTTVSKITVSFWRICATLAVGPMYLTISAAAPLREHTILSLTTDSEIVVFYTLYLMVPLLKRHFHLAWHGFTTESVYMRGTKSQSYGQCVYKMSHVFIGFSGGWGSRRLSSGFPPSIWLGGSGGQSGYPAGSHPSPLGKVTSWSSTLGSPFPTGFP